MAARWLCGLEPEVCDAWRFVPDGFFSPSQDCSKHVFASVPTAQDSRAMPLHGGCAASSQSDAADDNDALYIDIQDEVARRLERVRRCTAAATSSDCLRAAPDQAVTGEGASSQRPDVKQRKRGADGYTGRELRLFYCRSAAEAWLGRLTDALACEQDAACPADVADVSKRNPSGWYVRVQREAKKLQTLLGTSEREECVLHCTLKGGPGRQTQYYNDLAQAQFVQTLSAETRRRVFCEYASFDLKSAHLFVAYGAVELQVGAEAAREQCPFLSGCVQNPDNARAVVAAELGVSTAVAKTQILASLNRVCNSRSASLRNLMGERDVWVAALRQHPNASSGAAPTGSISEGSLMLQSVEAACVDAMAESLACSGYEVGAFVADEVMARPLAGAQASSIAARRAEAHVKTTVGISIRLEVAYEPLGAGVQS